VAVKIAAGQQLHIYLHLFNVGSSELSGTSAIEVVTTRADQIEHEAELFVWGKTEGLVIPPSTTSEHTASCVVPSASNLFIMQPHMHYVGSHLKLTHTSSGGAPTVLFDQDYSFDAQVHVAFEPAVALGAGDELTIRCTYDNPHPQEISFGETSGDEMCFAGLWVYPAGAPFCP
jgi:hypothetical protein